MNIRSPFNYRLALNREVIVDWLRDFAEAMPAAQCLEVGPGGHPLLADVAAIPAGQKNAMDLPAFRGTWADEFGIRFFAQNAGEDRWAFDDNSLDLVVTSQCLEHIPDTDHFIAEALRVRKPGGICIGSVPNLGGLLNALLLLCTYTSPNHHVSDRYSRGAGPLRKMRDRNAAGTPGRGHLRLVLMRAMNELLTAYGFTILRNHGGSWGTPVLGKALAGLLPHYGIFTTVMACKN